MSVLRVLGATLPELWRLPDEKFGWNRFGLAIAFFCIRKRFTRIEEFFKHSKRMPLLFDEATQNLDGHNFHREGRAFRFREAAKIVPHFRLFQLCINRDIIGASPLSWLRRKLIEFNGPFFHIVEAGTAVSGPHKRLTSDLRAFKRCAIQLLLCNPNQTLDYAQKAQPLLRCRWTPRPL